MLFPAISVNWKILLSNQLLNDGKSELTLRQQLSSTNNILQQKIVLLKTLDDVKRLQRKTEIDYIVSVLFKNTRTYSW